MIYPYLPLHPVQCARHHVEGASGGAQVAEGRGAVERPHVPPVAVEPAVGEEAPVEVVLQHQPETPRDALLLGRQVRAAREGKGDIIETNFPSVHSMS